MQYIDHVGMFNQASSFHGRSQRSQHSSTGGSIVGGGCGGGGGGGGSTGGGGGGQDSPHSPNSFRDRVDSDQSQSSVASGRVSLSSGYSEFRRNPSPVPGGMMSQPIIDAKPIEFWPGGGSVGGCNREQIQVWTIHLDCLYRLCKYYKIRLSNDFCFKL